LHKNLYDLNLSTFR